MVELIEYPDNCLVPASSCLDLSFSDDKITEGAGTKANVTIQLSILDDISIDSFLCINDVTFSFGAVRDDYNNFIEYSTDNATLGVNIVNSVLSNSYLSRVLSISTDGTQLVIDSLNCKDSIDVTLKNRINDLADLNYNAASQRLAIPQNYKLKLYLSCNEEVICEIKDGIDLYPSIVSDCDECEVSEYDLSIDVSPYVCDCVYTPLPAFDRTLLNWRPERLADLSFTWGASYGSPVNQFGTNFHAFKDLKIVNYQRQVGDWDAINNHCHESTEQEFFSLYNDGDTVCANQHLWLHAHIPRGYKVQSYVIITTATNTVSIVLDSLLELTQDSIVEAQAGLIQIQEEIEAAGYSICDIKSYSINVIIYNIRGVLKQLTKEYKATCKCDCTSEFIFLNSKGQYDSIMLHCPDEINLEVLRSFCEGCDACNNDTRNNNKAINSVESSELISCYFLSEKRYNNEILQEFLCSSDVYYCEEGGLYAVEPVSTDALLSKRNGTLSNQYQFRVTNQKTLIK